MRRISLIATMAILSVSCSPASLPQNSSTSASSSSGEIARIAGEISRLSRARETPDQAINSFFEVARLGRELDCHTLVLSEDDALGTAAITRAADSFFSGVALSARTRYRRTVQECLQRSERLALDIREVTMDTPTRAVAIINLRNTSAIPESASADASDDERRRRRDGEDYRVRLTKTSDGWKIEQVDSRSLATREWRAQWSEQELYPSFAFFPTLP